ncbi:MAG: glycosyltransferase [Candidatus Omnitrophica bacterium]|nr:glycosyltransferase [Candidatus Omnitrophota bacterium]
MKNKFSLVVPTFNEKNNIKSICDKLLGILGPFGLDFEIIIVDDDSPDKTWEAAGIIADKEPRIKVVRRRGEKDLSTAVVRGWQESSGNILGVIDADLQHPPEVITLLLEKMLDDKDAEIVIASRYAKGGGVSEWSFFRRFASWSATLISNFFLPEILTKVKDPMSGFFILRRSVIENIKLSPKGYKILLEVLAKGRYKHVDELPYIFQERERDSSKFGPRQFSNFLFHIFKLSIQTKEIYRITKYAVAGLCGACVTFLGYLYLIKIGFSQSLSYIFSLELAIINNFIINELWTFKDKSAKFPEFKSRLLRFVKFNLICVNGALISFLIFIIFSRFLSLSAVLSAFLGIAGGFIWNFIFSANLAWISRLYHREEIVNLVEKGYYHKALNANKIQNYWHNKKFQLISAKLGESPYLDIGSGPGVFFLLNSDLPGVKINIDYSHKQLSYGKGINHKAYFVSALAGNLPISDDSIGTVSLIETIEHLGNNEVMDCLREAHRVLRKGGKMLVSTPNYRSIWPLLEVLVSRLGPVDYTKQHITHFNLEKLRFIIEAAGFKVKDKQTFFIFSPFFSFLGGKISDFLFEKEKRFLPGFGSLLLIEAEKV